jgi:hypothetical protein
MRTNFVSELRGEWFELADERIAQLSSARAAWRDYFRQDDS